MVPGRSLTAADIDDVLRGRPALLRIFDGHSALASTQALRIAGVDGPRRFAEQSEVVCGADGTPTGLLLEMAAIGLVVGAVPSATVEEVAAHTHRALSPDGRARDHRGARARARPARLPVLTILKFCLLALLYLFLARVVWTVVLRVCGALPAAAARARAGTRQAEGRRRRGDRGGSSSSKPRPRAARAFEVNGELTIGARRVAGSRCPTTRSCRRCTRASSSATATCASKTSARRTARSSTAPLLTGDVKLRKGDRVQVGQTVLEATR